MRGHLAAHPEDEMTAWAVGGGSESLDRCGAPSPLVTEGAATGAVPPGERASGQSCCVLEKPRAG